MKRKDSVAEILLMKHLNELNSVGWVREYLFHSVRRWRFDFAFPFQSPQVAIEIDGGTWIHGRHTRGKGFEGDLRKMNEAAKLGWTIIRFTPNMISRGESKAFLAELFGRKP